MSAKAGPAAQAAQRTRDAPARIWEVLALGGSTAACFALSLSLSVPGARALDVNVELVAQVVPGLAGRDPSGVVALQVVGILATYWMRRTTEIATRLLCALVSSAVFALSVSTGVAYLAQRSAAAEAGERAAVASAKIAHRRAEEAVSRAEAAVAEAERMASDQAVAAAEARIVEAEAHRRFGHSFTRGCDPAHTTEPASIALCRRWRDAKTDRARAERQAETASASLPELRRALVEKRRGAAKAESALAAARLQARASGVPPEAGDTDEPWRSWSAADLRAAAIAVIVEVAMIALLLALTEALARRTLARQARVVADKLACRPREQFEEQRRFLEAEPPIAPVVSSLETAPEPPTSEAPQLSSPGVELEIAAPDPHGGRLAGPSRAAPCAMRHNIPRRATPSDTSHDAACRDAGPRAAPKSASSAARRELHPDDVLAALIALADGRETLPMSRRQAAIALTGRLERSQRTIERHMRALLERGVIGADARSVTLVRAPQTASNDGNQD